MTCNEPVVEKDYLHYLFSRKRYHSHSWHKSHDCKCLCSFLTGLGKHTSPSPLVRTAQPGPAAMLGRESDWQAE